MTFSGFTSRRGERMQKTPTAGRCSAWFLCLCLATLIRGAGVAGSAQPAPAGTPARGEGVIRGRVTAEDDGRPLRRARITCVEAGSRETYRTTSDAAGYFECTRLPAGSYVVSARRTGYVGAAFGAEPEQKSAPVPIRIAGTGDRHEADISLIRGGVIEGRITDAYGDPVSDAVVSASRPDTAGKIGTTWDMRGVTDDQGQFRLWSLRRGTYFVTARASAGPGSRGGSVATAFAFYPGAPMVSGAKGVAVEPGREAGGIDFSITPARLATISGVVLDSGGRAVAGGRVTVRAANPDLGGMYVVGEYRTSASGAFAATQLPPGTYELTATAPGQRAASETGVVTTSTAGDDVIGLTIATAPPR